MSPIRALVVDDAVVVRRMVSDVLDEDPGIEVAGVAANGRIALQKVPQVSPDVIILDVEMPVMDGLETLKALGKEYPDLPVIMFSTLTERGAEVTLDALSLGASDYVTKPSNVGSVVLARQRIREELIPRIYALTGKGTPGLPPPRSAPRRQVVPTPKPVTATTRLRPSLPGRVTAVVIGVSTGGPNALAEVIPALPPDFPVPVLIVQHMPPLFTRLLADRLSSGGGLPAEEAVSGTRILPGRALLAPGDWHMEVEVRDSAHLVRLHQGPQENSCRPAVDVLFRSAARVFGPGTLGIVLTGMGKDGLRGSEDIHRAGGRIIVQDQASSVVWGMPGYVAEAGLAHRILPLDRVAEELRRVVGTGIRPNPFATKVATG
ncbi:MAG: chemotaxis response regulator protein-glutamate methylesterase [Gemmatimonadales bacterium]|nr:MAG: chemotaxis response regulator protein-glutamate methylesterase [Gemmatimonadales bacterium]